MASSALCCPIRQVLVHVYPSSSKAWSEPRVTVHVGRRVVVARRAGGGTAQPLHPAGHLHGPRARLVTGACGPAPSAGSGSTPLAPNHSPS